MTTEIVTLAEVKTHLNISTPTNDAELAGFIAAAQDFVESRVGAVVDRTVTEVVDQESGFLFLMHPVLSLTSVANAYTTYPCTYSTAALTAASPELSTGTVWMTGSYPWTPDKLTVVYQAGRATVPPAIRQATLDYIKWAWETQRGPTPAPFPGGGDDLEVVAPATVPYRILQALEPYMRPVVA